MNPVKRQMGRDKINFYDKKKNKINIISVAMFNNENK